MICPQAHPGFPVGFHVFSWASLLVTAQAGQWEGPLYPLDGMVGKGGPELMAVPGYSP